MSCSCTHADPVACENGQDDQCICWCHQIASAQKPHEPLEDYRLEIARLRGLLGYVAACLDKSQFCGEADQAYASSIAEHICKQLERKQEL